MISYAQNLEDVLLARFFETESDCFYIDVGAGHPCYHSVTKHFSDSGWTGINIEPRKALYHELRRERPNDSNLNVAVSDIESNVTLYEVICEDFAGTDQGGLTTLDPASAKEYRNQGLKVIERNIRCQRLSTICESHSVEQIGFLKIDVEGLELQVLRSLDFQRWRPRLVVAESTVPRTMTPRDDGLAEYMSLQNYSLEHHDGLNCFFLRQEDAHLKYRLAAPANVLDGYATIETIKLQQKIEHLSKALSEAQTDNERLQQDFSLADTARRLRNSLFMRRAG